MKSFNSPILFLELLLLFSAVLAKAAKNVESEGITGEQREVSILDLVTAGSGHQEEWKRGGGGDLSSHHHSSSGKKAAEGHKNYENFEKGLSGHDKKQELSESHREEGGNKKEHHDEGNHHHREDYEKKNEKDNSHGRKGGFKKGHSTKGTHVIHKLNEYKKNKEFFDEDYEQEMHEKSGGFHHSRGSKAGDVSKSGHHSTKFEENVNGKMGNLEDLYRYIGQIGRQNGGGYEERFNYGKKYGREEDRAGHKSWHDTGKGKF